MKNLPTPFLRRVRKSLRHLETNSKVLTSTMISSPRLYQWEYFKNAGASIRIWNCQSYSKCFGLTIHYSLLRDSFTNATEKDSFKLPSTITHSLKVACLSTLKIKLLIIFSHSVTVSTLYTTKSCKGTLWQTLREKESSTKWDKSLERKLKIWKRHKNKQHLKD